MTAEQVLGWVVPLLLGVIMTLITVGYRGISRRLDDIERKVDHFSSTSERMMRAEKDIETLFSKMERQVILQSEQDLAVLAVKMDKGMGKS